MFSAARGFLREESTGFSNDQNTRSGSFRDCPVGDAADGADGWIADTIDDYNLLTGRYLVDALDDGFQKITRRPEFTIQKLACVAFVEHNGPDVAVGDSEGMTVLGHQRVLHTLSDGLDVAHAVRSI